MGFGLTLSKMLEHFVNEPDMIISSIMLSLKDITEILYFYFTELSLTACYVILFILAARYLLRKAPRIYSYALWGIVYFKLVAVFKLDFWKHSFIPQAQIDQVYQNITPDYTAFYDTEAGVVSIVQSENILPATISPVEEFYTPAFIWSAVLIIILCIAFVSFVRMVCATANTKQKLHDNIYICRYISSPFVFGIIRPKILLPEGLTEQEQNYVITHEKAHIKRGDHIIKPFAFFITVIHWFNPLVWLSFFLMEKDMEMSCDEKVISVLGNEHKQDYSRCILSLASGRRFVPKAYLSFGDSDTKKRVKNVLNYKKPAVIASVMICIGIAVIAIGMLSDSQYSLPLQSQSAETDFAAMEENFPDGDDRFAFQFNDLTTKVEFNLPIGWTLEKRNIQVGEEPEYLTVDDDFSDVWDIYNTNGEFVGAMVFVNYTEYIGAETKLMAIYGPVALGNMYSFDLSAENYFAVEKDQNGLWEKAVTKVYHSPSLVHNNGGLGDAVYGDGILAYSRECLAFVAFEFRENYFSQKELRYIAASVDISPAEIFSGIAASVLNMQYRNMETGTDFDVSEHVSNDVLALLKAKEEIAKHRIRVFGTGKDSYNVQVIPADKENWVEERYHAEIKMQVLRTFRYNDANFNSSASDVVSLTLEADALGNITVTDYRIDGKDTTFGDMDKDYWSAVEKGSGQQFLNEFVSEYKSFISNSSSSADDVIVNEIASNTSIAAVDHASKPEIAEIVTVDYKIDQLYSIACKYNYTAEEIRALYKNIGFGWLSSEIFADGISENVKTVYNMYIDGKPEEEIRDFAKSELYKRGLDEETVKSLCNASWHPIELYCMNDTRLYQAVNRIKQWDFSVYCAAESAENSYIITYCDDKFLPVSSDNTLYNPNSFDVRVHLLSDGNSEIVTEIPAGESAVAIGIEKATKYTVGLHADVAENTEIKLIIYEDM